MSEPIEVTDENFEEEVLEADRPVLVDFWASWCGPCKMLAPVIEEIAENYEDELKVCKLNVDDNQETASRFEVMSIPTMIVFNDGEVDNKLVGYMPKGKLLKELELAQ
ncbi:thioredoxin [Halarsenatibacter silvermanii]|uniref:Thioredoxin n=1 Tax=Halarsenatibacter silvermanii TaxID=321763 RepID=A0A1G9HYA5_9FIRM|nr:thioredoxin [Halarsenatibacter silvermanii]SDL17948.1 thioredoxin [Halarsenatibacter silvermanii]